MLRGLLDDIIAFLIVLYACVFFWICRLLGVDLEEDF